MLPIFKLNFPDRAPRAPQMTELCWLSNCKLVRQANARLLLFYVDEIIYPSTVLRESGITAITTTQLNDKLQQLNDKIQPPLVARAARAPIDRPNFALS